MKCFYVSAIYDERAYRQYFCHMGEQAGIHSDEMMHVEIEKDIFSQEQYEIQTSELPMILDLSKVTTEILMFLYGRYVRCPHKTFLLLSRETAQDFDWGFGAGVCMWSGNEKEDQRLLISIERDFAFYLKQGSSFEPEPVLDYLKKYWDHGRFLPDRYSDSGMSFFRIERSEENTGEAISRRLKKCVVEENEEQFKEELRNIEVNDNIDPIDYIIISRQCMEMQLPVYRVAVLEQGVHTWGENHHELLFELIDAYIDSANREWRKKALTLAEEYFQITYDEEGLPVFVKDRMSHPVKEDYIKSLFNAYIGLEKYRFLDALCVYEEEFCQGSDVPSIHYIFKRNKAICLRQAGKHLQALKLFCQLFLQDENDNTLSLIIYSLKSLERYRDAAELLCCLCWLNPEQEEKLIEIAQLMSESAIAYEEKTGWYHTGRIGNQYKKQVIPLLFFVYSFEDNQGKRSLTYEIDKVLETLKEDEMRNFLRRYRMDLGRIWGEFAYMYEKKYDFSAVRYLEEGYHRTVEGEWDVRQNIIDRIKNIADTIR